MFGRRHSEKLPPAGQYGRHFCSSSSKEIPSRCAPFQQWMERKPDGGVVFRSVRAEEREERRYNVGKQKAMEALFTKIQSEFEKEEKGRRELLRQVLRSAECN